MNRRTRKCIHSAAQKLRALAQKKRRLADRLQRSTSSLAQIQKKAASLKEDALEENISNLPPRQQEAVRQCFAAAKVKAKGARYTKKWLLECIMMKMKSPRLYEHLRKNNILCLPSKSTLKRHMVSYRSSFGFNSNVLRQLKDKTAGIDPYKRHGGLVIDEVKLSEHLSVKKAGVIEGFVDLGKYTSADQQHVPSDHGMVILFVPLVGKWNQIIGCFATRNNMKGRILAQVITEATILAENSGLFVDFITCDGASWNRAMWSIMGIRGSASSVKCKVRHPVDHSRSLFFVSDFPHLVKCLRNSLLKGPFNTPDGHVS